MSQNKDHSEFFTPSFSTEATVSLPSGTAQDFHFSQYETVRKTKKSCNLLSFVSIFSREVYTNFCAWVSLYFFPFLTINIKERNPKDINPLCVLPSTDWLNRTPLQWSDWPDPWDILVELFALLQISMRSLATPRLSSHLQNLTEALRQIHQEFWGHNIQRLYKCQVELWVRTAITHTLCSPSKPISKLRSQTLVQEALSFSPNTIQQC